jgi:nicotinamidase-related amidase
MKPALLVIDVQKQFFGRSPVTDESLNRAIVFINEAIAFFRRQDLPVVCVQHIDEEDGLLPGTPGFDLPEHLAILPDDPHIHKTYGNSFNKTPLEQVLRDRGVDTPVICGYMAENCVLSTYRGALDRDLRPILLRNALASRNPGNIPFVESINDLVSLGGLMKLLS